MKKIKEKDKRNDNNDNIINSKDPTEILNNDENTENRFIKQKSNIMLNQEDYIDELILEETFNLRYSDPINSIALTDDNLLFGSMIGKVVLYNISTRKTKRLYEMTNESISGCSLDSKIGDKKIFYVSIGDESVISLQEKINENNDIEIQSNTINNYDTQQNHMLNCNQAFTMLWKNKLLIIFLYHAKEHDEQICTYSTSYCLVTYSIKNIQNELMEEGKIDMSNYSVPFDFRYNCFLFLEYQKDLRNLSLFTFKGKDSNKKIFMSFRKEDGHISFAKILNKNIILIVRNSSLIEIYNIEDNYQLIGEFNNDSEINAIDFYDTINNESSSSIKVENDSILSAKLKEEQCCYIIFFDENQNIIELEFKYNLTNKNKQKLNIVIKMNINDIKGITDEIKNKGLFNLDFPYYIKNSPNYIAITTDQACFLLKKHKKI